MQAKDSTIALDDYEDHFVLRRTAEDGSVTNIELSPFDVMTLAQSAPLFRERILSRFHQGGEVSAVFVTDVTRVGLAHDALGESILLTMIAGNGAQMMYSLSDEIAQTLAERLPVKLAEMRNLKLGLQ